MEVKQFFDQQLTLWPLAKLNFDTLKFVQSKSINFGDFEVLVQFNPARIVSSGAKTDAKSISERKCFLCKKNRPSEQIRIDFGAFELLINPFPIFSEHFTIPLKEHLPQQIKPFFGDMLQLTKQLERYLIFYNGPNCGASAPDHMHFQAGTKNFLPLVNDFNRLKDSHTDLLISTDKMQLFQLKNYLRTVYCIESSDFESICDAFSKLYSHFESDLQLEPMMNIVSTYQNNKWQVFVLPRKSFRPWQYNAPENEQLLISPATVEMCGVFITPLKDHFERVSKEDVISIFNQVSV